MEKVKVGKIINTHGLKGEMKVYSYSDRIEMRLAPQQHVYIKHQETMQEVVVKSFRYHKNVVLVCFYDFEDINKVEQYKDCLIYADVQVDDNHVYYFQLMNCKVYDQNDQLLGVVEDILETGANPVLRVNKKILIPYVDVFIIEENIKEKYLKVNILEGML